MALAQQLNQLKQSQKKQTQPSLLYTQQVSAEIELDTIYYIGLKGIQKLCQIDSQFQFIQASLFKVDRKGICRQLINKQENAELDKELRQCLLLMSNYFNYEGTHQAMEYLLRNYSLNEFLFDELIVYFMQYHTHTIYIRLLQNLVDQQRNGMWAFLYEPVSRAQTISRDLLVRQMQLDYRLLKKVIDFAYNGLIPLENGANDIIIGVEDEFTLTQNEIKQIKMKQPKILSFIFAILFELNVNNNYLEQIRGGLLRLIGQCLEVKSEESIGFVYLLLLNQLYDSQKNWLNEAQIHGIATHIYEDFDNFMDLAVMLYQFGVQTDEQISLKFLRRDLSLYYNNGLLFLEILKPFGKGMIPQLELNELLNYLQALISSEDNGKFIDALIPMMHDQLLDVVRPYLKDTEYKLLFPKGNQVYLTQDNVDKVLRDKEKLKQISVGNMHSLIDECFKYYQQTKSNKYVELLELCVQISEQSFPQATLFKVDKLYELFFNGSLKLTPLIKYVHHHQEQANTLRTILYYSVHHNMQMINGVLKPLNLNVKDKNELYKTLQNESEDLFNQCYLEKQTILLAQQTQINIAFHLQDDDKLQEFIDQYQKDDEFIQNILSQLAQYQLLNLGNNLSIRVLKLVDIDPFIFFNDQLNQLGRLKILLHKSSVNAQFMLKLFLHYDSLTKQEQELFILLATTNKNLLLQDIEFGKIQFKSEDLKSTFGQFIKNKSDANLSKSLANLRNQETLLKLQFNFLKINDSVQNQLVSIANIIANSKNHNQQLLSQFIKYIEHHFHPSLLESYLIIQQNIVEADYQFLQKILFKLSKESAIVINKYLNHPQYNSKLRTQFILFVYSQPIPDKQIISDETLDFPILIKLLDTPSLEIVTNLINLFKANIQYLQLPTIKELFQLNCKYLYLINSMIYSYLEIHQCDLLEPLQLQLKSYLQTNPDLGDHSNYLIVSSIVKLIAKHTQFKMQTKAFKAIIDPSLNLYDQLLYLKIVVEQFQSHNPQYFNSSLSAYFIAKTVHLTQDSIPNESLLQYFSLFPIENWWVVALIVASIRLPEDYIQILKDYMNKQTAQTKIYWITALSETIFYRTTKAQKSLKVKVSQKFKQFKISNLEISIRKSFVAFKGDQAKIIRTKLSFLRTLEFMQTFLEQSKKFLLSTDLNEEQLQLVKSCVIHLQKFANIFIKSKLRKLSESIRSQLINSIKIETLIPLITNCITTRSIASILLLSFNDLLHTDTVLIKKQHHPLLVKLVQQMIETLDKPATTEMLITLNYIYNIPQVVNSLKSVNQELIQILLKQCYSLPVQDRCLVLNLFSLIALANNYHYIELLGEVQQEFIKLYAMQFNEEGVEQAFNFVFDDKLKLKQSKAVLQETQNNLIKGFKGLISKQDLEENIILAIIDQNKQNLDQILEFIEKRILIDILPNLIEKVIRINPRVTQNCIIFIGELIQQCEQGLVATCYVQISKQLLNVFDYAREQFIDNEMKGGIFLADELEEKVIETFLSLVVKINDIQLKKVYSNLISWSKQNINSGYNYQKYRRITFFKLSNQISDKLCQYFTKYYVYIFDAIINELQTFHGYFYETPKQIKLQKRQQDECDMHYKLELLLCRHVLSAISSLCQHDQDQFLDTEKFERLCEPLAGTLDCAKLNNFEPILPFIDEWITPSILAVFNLVNDDYKWKDLHSKIMQVIAKHSTKKNEISALIAIGIVKLIHRLIDQLDDRYLVLMNDLIPYLHQLTSSTLNSDELETRVKSLIIRLTQLSGEDIVGFLK